MDDYRIKYTIPENHNDTYFDDGCQLGVSDHNRWLLMVGFSIVLCVTLSGNIIVIIVLGLVTNLKNDINNYLLNLAVADLFIGIFCLPAKTFYIMTENWSLGSTSCTLIVVIQHTVMMVSALTLTIIGIDRYMAVKSPLQTRRNGSQSKFNSVVIWIISSFIALIPGLTHHVRRATICGREVTVCGDDFSSNMTNLGLYYQLLLFICECAAPLSVIAYTYSVVCFKLWGRRLPGNADQNRDLTIIRNKKKTIKMLVSIVVLFAVCLVPLQLYHFVAVSSLRSYVTDKEGVFFTIYYISLWLSMIHSGINPIVYGFMNENFRVDLMKLVRWSLPCVVRRSTNQRRRGYSGGYPLQTTSTYFVTKQNYHTCSSRRSSITCRDSNDYCTVHSAALQEDKI